MPLLPPSDYVPVTPKYHEISAAQVGIDGIDRTADQGEGNYEVPADHALVIQPGGEDDLLAYAMYALTGLNTERPVKADFSIAAAPIQPGGEEDLPLCFWVGISNYTNYAWEWHGPYSSPDNAVNVDLNDLLGGVDIRDRYISAANVLYMVVLTEAGAEFVGPGNPLGLTAARIDLLTVNKLTVGELGYRSTRPHFPLIASIGVGGATASSAKQAAALDPSQYVTLTWTHVFDPSDPDAEAIQYKVYRKGPDGELLPIGTVNAPEQQYIDPTDNASWVPEAVPGALYTYYLRAYNHAGFTPFDWVQYVIPLLGPTDLQASDGAFINKIALTWTKAEGATGYKVYRDGQAETDVIATLADVATYDDTSVANFDPHTYWVRGTTLDLPEGGLFSAPDVGYVSGGEPIAILDANPLFGAPPLTVSFDAGSSYDPDDGVSPGAGIVKYEWDWDGDGTYDLDSGLDSTVTHEYDADGTYNAVVRVTDNEAITGTDSVGINVSSQPRIITDIVSLSFDEASGWPKDSSNNYRVLITELSVDDIDGNAESFAPEALHLYANVKYEGDETGIYRALPEEILWHIVDGGGLAQVSNSSGEEGLLTFINRGRIVVEAQVSGDFALTKTMSFILLSIDSLSLQLQSGGVGPISIQPNDEVTFKAIGTFDWDNVINGNEVTQNLIGCCAWGMLPDAGNSGSFVMYPATGVLSADLAHIGDSVRVYCEFPATDNVTIYDNQKRSSEYLVVNVN